MRLSSTFLSLDRDVHDGARRRRGAPRSAWPAAGLDRLRERAEVLASSVAATPWAGRYRVPRAAGDALRVPEPRRVGRGPAPGRVRGVGRRLPRAGAGPVHRHGAARGRRRVRRARPERRPGARPPRRPAARARGRGLRLPGPRVDDRRRRARRRGELRPHGRSRVRRSHRPRRGPGADRDEDARAQRGPLRPPRRRSAGGSPSRLPIASTWRAPRASCRRSRSTRPRARSTATTRDRSSSRPRRGARTGGSTRPAWR